MLAMAEKKNAIATNQDITDIDIKLNALKDLKTKITEFQTSGSGKKYDASVELGILKSLRAFIFISISVVSLLEAIALLFSSIALANSLVTFLILFQYNFDHQYNYHNMDISNL